MKTRRILILLLCLFFLGRPHLTKAEDLEKIAVTLPENAVVAGTRLFLGEIAEISGEGELAAQVKEANVGTAPRPGDWRRLTKGQIEVRLRQAGLDLKKIEFLGTQAVRVYGLAEDMPSAENNDPPALQVIVLQRDVSRGEILTAADLAAEEKEIGYGSRQAGWP
ncbi:MAG TPA: hypothetical protein GX528_08275 [Firmicutes bacterium]|nr:hypothetical protein [Bacillota bacterium]